MTNNEMIVIKLDGVEARLWRDLVNGLELETDKELYENTVREIFEAGLVEFNKHLMSDLPKEDLNHIQNQILSLRHVRVLYNFELVRLAEESVFINVNDEGILIVYENKQEVENGNIFFLPDGEALMIPSSAIIEDDVEVDYSRLFEGMM